MGNYVTASAMRTYKIDGAVVDLSTYSDVEIETEIGMAEALIERICNDRFYSYEEVLKLDGNGLCKLFFFPKSSYKLLSVTTVKEYDIDQTTVLETYVVNDDFLVYPHYIETAKWFPGDSPRRRFGSGGVWPRGQQNIWIDGTWGWATTPPEIVKAATLLTLEAMRPGSANLTGRGIKQATWPDFTITFKGGESDYGTMSTGYEEIDRILFQLINRIDMFNVIPDNRESYDSGGITLI